MYTSQSRPKRSERLHPPSKKAVDVAAASDTSQKRSRCMDPQPSTDCAGASSLSSDPQPQGFPPGVMDQLVARVADEVTRRLSPPDTGHQPLAVPSALSEVPLGSVPLVQSTSDQVDAAVQSLISTAQSALSGELQVVYSAQPSQMFISPSLPVDAWVSNKVKAKIWNNEFFEFSSG